MIRFFTLLSALICGMQSTPILAVQKQAQEKPVIQYVIVVDPNTGLRNVAILILGIPFIVYSSVFAAGGAVGAVGGLAGLIVGKGIYEMVGAKPLPDSDPLSHPVIFRLASAACMLGGAAVALVSWRVTKKVGTEIYKVLFGPETRVDTPKTPQALTIA